MQVKMLRGMAIGASAVLGLALITPSAGAQAQTSGLRFGVQGLLESSDGSTTFGAGGFFKYHLADISGHPITGRAGFDYFFPDAGTWWHISGDALIDITNKDSEIKPYVGAGLTYGHWSDGGFSESSTDPHLIGGINLLGNSKLMPFGEVKFVMHDGGNSTFFKIGFHLK